jgi:hypothetical protein
MQNKYLFFGLMTFDEIQHLCFMKYVMVLAYKPIYNFLLFVLLIDMSQVVMLCLTAFR